MNAGRIAGIDVTDEEWFAIELQAHFKKDPGAIALVEIVKQRLATTARSAYEAWKTGSGTGQAEERIDPINQPGEQKTTLLTHALDVEPDCPEGDELLGWLYDLMDLS